MNAPVQPGDVLAGKYRVERVLGQGGMGVVVAAQHIQMNQRVALKFLLPDVLKSPELVARFAREAQATGKIKSEHVARVLDVGTLETGAPFMVMEYLEGADLAQILKQRGPLPGQDAIEYVLQACEALAEAHVAGIVHRDLKPANLFLTQRADGSPSIKVLDFGIAKAALEEGQPQQALTQTSAVIGSPQYMSPEQLKSSRRVDPRTDIWALGLILQELLTGEAPFRADTVPQLYVAILSERPSQLRMRRPDAPHGLEAVVLRCLEKEPANRFANIALFASALSEYASPRSRTSVERVNRIIAGSSDSGNSGPRLPPMAPPSAIPPTQLASSSHQPSSVPTVGAAPAMMHTPLPAQLSYAHQPYNPQPPQYAPPAYGAMTETPKEGTPVAFIILLAVVAILVVGGGGCVICIAIVRS